MDPDSDATKACIKAGYSVKSATKIGYENKIKLDLHIQARLKELRKDRESEIADETEVLLFLTKVMRRLETESVVVTVRNRKSYTDDKGNKVTEDTETPTVVEIPSRLMDANKGAELLGKKYKSWTDRVEADIDTEITIVMDDVSKDWAK
jgi:phage terminase small subunit